MRFPISFSSAWRPVLGAFGMAPARSYVELSRDHLHVAAGVWFEESLPLRDIVSVEPSSWPWYGGYGVKLGPGDAVSVVAAREGLVEVTFARPQTMHVLLAVHRTKLRLSLVDPDGFIRTIRERIATHADARRS